MLDTVGHWAVVSQLHTPGQTVIVLIVIGLVKTAAAVIPVAVEYGKLGGRRFWRVIGWVGCIGLTIYGGIYSATAMTMLTGLVSPANGYRKTVREVHAFA